MTSSAPASPFEWVFLAICFLLLLAAHLMFGALTAESALSLAIGWSALLAVGAIVLPRPGSGALRALAVPALGFSIVILAACLSLTDLAPGAGHPIWARLGLPVSATVDRSETLLEIAKLLGLGVTFLVGWGLGTRGSTGLRAVKIAAFSGALLAAIAIVMELARIGPDTQVGRLEAAFLSPNTAGALFGASLCLNMGLLMRASRKARGQVFRFGLIFTLAGTVVTAAALLMTMSRGAITITAGALVCMILVRARSNRWTPGQMTAGIGLLVVAAALVVTLGGDLMARFTTVGDDATLRRLIFETHGRAFSEAPWLGYGLGSFDTVNRINLTADNYAALWNIRAAHNVYLQWLEEGGILAAVPMFVTIGAVVIQTALQTAHRRVNLAPLYGLLAVDAVLLLHGIVDFALQTYSIALLWSFLLGLQLTLSDIGSGRGAPR